MIKLTNFKTITVNYRQISYYAVNMHAYNWKTLLLAVSQHCHHCINNNLIIAIAAIAMATAIIAIYFWPQKRVIKIENVLYIHVTEYIICVQ